MAMTTMIDVKVSCGKCGGTEITSYDSIIATASIIGWYRTTAGDIEPEYTGDTDVCWDTQAPYDKAKPWQCNGCYELLADDDLVVEEIPCTTP